MTRKTGTAVAVVLAALILAAPAATGSTMGTLKGKIVDQQGFPMSGVCIYLSSPVLLGIRTFITTYTGQYTFFELPPGTYRMMTELTGFKTITVEDIRLGPGGSIITNFKMQPSELEEEKVSRSPQPSIDLGTVRLTTVLDKDILTHIPLPRDFSAILALVPGVVAADDRPTTQVSIHGAPETANSFMDDGVNMTDPVSGAILSRINVDLIDQVVVETAGLPVDRGPTQGAYINVLRKIGSNASAGSLTFAGTGWYLTKSLWAGHEPAGSAVTAPVTQTSNLDLSLVQGGSAFEDVAWYFTSLRIKGTTQSGPFALWTDPDGGPHYPYDWNDVYKSGNFKASVRIAPKFEGTLDLDLSAGHQSYYEPDQVWYRTPEATRRLSSQPTFLMRAQLIYTMNPKTLFDFSLGFSTRRQNIDLNSMASSQAQFFDIVTGRAWGSGVYNDSEKRNRMNARGSLLRLIDEALGASHQLTVGIDYESLKSQSDVWKNDNLIMDYSNGSPYVYGQTVSPVSHETVGTGWIGFSIVPGTSSGFKTTRELSKLGFYAQDTLNFGQRVVLSLGLRFDNSDAQFASIVKYAVGNAVAKTVGEDVVKPVVGYNPFSSMGFGQWDNVITWYSLSPRVGLNIDLFGTGKTILRGSFSRLPENLGLGYSTILDPVPATRVHNFVWYDENGDGLVDADDSFTMFSENYGVYETESYESRVDPGLKPTFINEWTAGLEHEVSRDFSLSARFIYRSQKGAIADVMYDPESATSWYDAANSPAGWWVPFTTTVPGAGDYGDSTVTVYYRSNDAPDVSDRVENVSSLTRKYRGLELSFRKRMSHNWQLYGSVVWSKSTGTALDSLLSSGVSSSLLTPNSFVNVGSGSRTTYDRPLAIRLMGTVRFKYDFFLSAYYRYMSGAPWARTVSIVAPSAWAEENNVDATSAVTVYLESPGTRRFDAWQRTDLRLEKEIIRSGNMRWAISFDVLNVFGNKYKIIDGNDGYWYPNAEGTSSGTHNLSSTYGKAISLSGTRSLVFTLRLGF